MARHNHRFTVYDKMEADGVFDLNPANPDSRSKEGESLYRGPIEFPKMMYSPTGEFEIIVNGEEIETPRGPKLINQQTALISQVVSSAAQEAQLLSEGWHDHPAKAIAAAVEAGANAERKAAGLKPLVVPAIGAQTVISSQESEIRRLSAELAKFRDEARGELPPSVLGKQATAK